MTADARLGKHLTSFLNVSESNAQQSAPAQVGGLRPGRPDGLSLSHCVALLSYPERHIDESAGLVSCWPCRSAYRFLLPGHGRGRVL